MKATIVITDHDVDCTFDPPVPDEAHDPSRAELLAAAALLGISRALTGKGARATVNALVAFDRRTRSSAK